jgi:hypothetical protein
MLWKAVKDILQIAGYDVSALERELFSYNNEDGHKAEPPSGMAGYVSQQIKLAGLANKSANNKVT